MSGSSVQRLKRAEQAESSYNSVIQVLGAQDLSQDEQVQALLTATSDDYGAKIGRKFPMAPLVDGSTIPELTSYAALSAPEETLRLFPGLKECKRILVGDCQMDVCAPVSSRSLQNFPKWRGLMC